MEGRDLLQRFAHDEIAALIDSTSRSIARLRDKPKSAKRLHRCRKQLARLQAALHDLGTLAGVAPEFCARVRDLHRHAGALRDADVLLERVRQYGRNAFGGECQELIRLRKALRARRQRARGKLLRILDAKGAAP